MYPMWLETAVNARCILLRLPIRPGLWGKRAISRKPSLTEPEQALCHPQRQLCVFLSIAGLSLPPGLTRTGK